MVRKAISFALVGVVNTLVDAGLFFLALAYLTSSLVAANVLAWSIAVSCSYVMNSFVTFAAESGRKLRLWDYGRFVGSSVLAMVAARYLGLPVYAAKGLAIGVSFLVNFSMSHFVVFPARRAANRQPPSRPPAAG